MIKFNLIVSLLILPIMATDIAAQARFTPKELPYAYDALAPQVSEETLRFHHDKHYVGYVNKLNELILDTPYAQQPLEDIVVSADGAIFNNAAQMWNHEFFFDQLSPDGEARPTRGVAEGYRRGFRFVRAVQGPDGEGCRRPFRFGMGLARRGQIGQAGHRHGAERRQPDVPRHEAADVLRRMEHAYYIDYRNPSRRRRRALWDRIDWKVVADRYEKK